MVLCAPHVGIDKDGIVGKIHRAGHRESTGACGAAQGALKALKTAQFTGLNSENYLDYQINIIMHLMKPHLDSILEGEDEQVTLVYKMYEMIEAFLEEILHLDWQGPNSKLAIIGGIMLNCEGDGTDMFLPLKFEIRTKTGKVDLFDKTFK